MAVRNIEMNAFQYGVVSQIPPRSIPRGAAADSLNWLTKGTYIELRGGQKYMGISSVQNGTGRTTGIKKIIDAKGIEHLFGSFGKKVKYFDIPTSEWIESGTDILGANVVDSTGLGKEPIFFSAYVSLAGAQMWFNSTSSAVYGKIMAANGANPVQQYNSGKNFFGNILIDTARTLLFHTPKDTTGIYGSYVDSQNYTTVASEAITGPTFTLAFKGGAPVATCFAVSVTIGSITYTDDYCGNLIASDGSASGTINYATGAVVVPAVGVGTAAYQWEDSTNGGIADFTHATPRTASQGFTLRQDDGGTAMSINTYSTVYYCVHIKKTWALTIPTDDTQTTNLSYRDNVGISSEYASCQSGNGIYYIDTISDSQVRIRILTYQTGGSQQVIPVQLSQNIDLSKYNFDQSAAVEWGDFVLFSCATKDSVGLVNGVSQSINNRVLLYNKLWKSFDILDYTANCFEVYNGQLVGGDSISNNFINFFSGFDDFGQSINNYWIGNADNFQIPMKGMYRMRLFYEGLKKFKRLYLRGYIAAGQSYDVYAALDNGNFVKIGTVSGTGSYVDQGNSILIGQQMIGSKVIGSQSSNAVPAYFYEAFLPVRLDKFDFVQIKFVATGVGYVSIESAKYWDLRAKGKHIPRKYRNEPSSF